MLTANIANMIIISDRRNACLTPCFFMIQFFICQPTACTDSQHIGFPYTEMLRAYTRRKVTPWRRDKYYKEEILLLNPETAK